MRAVLAGALVFALALWLRLHAIDRESLWLDEAYSYKRAALPLLETINESMARFHNPVYFVFMHFWILFGDSELWLRLPSALAGALAAVMVFSSGYILAGTRAGLAAGTLLAIAPEQVYYGQETRMYATLSMAVGLALVGFTWLATHRSLAARPLWFLRRVFKDRPAPTRKAKLAWLACFLGATLAIYLHNTGVVFLAPFGVAMLLVTFACGRRGFSFFANASLVIGGALLVWSPYVMSLLGQAQRLTERFWATFPSLARCRRIARQLYLLDAPFDSLVSALVLGGVIAAIVLLRRRSYLFWALGLLALLGPVTMLLLSLHTPILGARLLIWAPLPLFVLVGAGVSVLRHPGWTLAFCAVALALTAPRLQFDYKDLSKERWRELHAAILPRIGPHTVVVANTRQEYLPLMYYFERRDGPLEPFPLIENPKTRFTRVTDKKEARAEMKAAKHLLIIDRKKGKRSKKLLKTLRKRWERVSTVYWDRIRVDELVRTKKDGSHAVKLKPFVAGNGKGGYAKVRSKRRLR
jgi:uncharacterized membrane protein